MVERVVDPWRDPRVCAGGPRSVPGTGPGHGKQVTGCPVGGPTIRWVGQAERDETLDEYRSSIDNIDAALIHLLAERFKVTRKVGAHKAAVDMPPADLEREASQVQRMRELAESTGLDPVFSEKFLRFVIDEVIRHHESAGNSAGNPASNDG